MTAASRRMHRNRVRKLAKCPDCSSEVLVRSASDADTIQAEVFHDSTCPWFTSRGAGRSFREFRILASQGADR
jgi:hypothetical protein